MDSKPEISIVIVNWNTRDLLRDCLNSVFAEPTALLLEVIVVDNNSSDDSVEMVRREFPQAHLIQNQKNIGFAAANNLALPLCRADKVLLLNSDTVVVANALRTLVDFLDRHPSAGAVAPKLEQSHAVDILGCGRQLSLRTAANHWLFLARLFPGVRACEGVYYYRGKHDDRVREVEWISGACMLVRRSVIDQVGPLDEQWFMYAEDQEWCARMKKSGWKIFHIPAALVEHRHGASLEQNPNIAVLPLKANRDLFVRLNSPSRLQLFAFDLIVTTGLILRGLIEALRSCGSSGSSRDFRRRRAAKFLGDAELVWTRIRAGAN
jgi:GT2 family glycosyltransferase